MAIKGDFESISLKNLKMVCNELNDSGLVEKKKKVDTKKLKKKLDLIEGFIDAIESIPEKSEEETKLEKEHNKVVEMHNSITDIIDQAENGETADPEPEAGEKDESEPEPEKKSEKKDKGKGKAKEKAKPKAEKKEKSEKKSEGKKKGGLPHMNAPKDDLGAVIGKGTNLINEEFKAGATFEEIADKIGCKPGRVRTHYASLVKSGVEFETKTRKYKLIGGKEKDTVYWVKIKKIPKNFKKV